MLSSARLAHPYAHAAFDYALEHRQLAVWSSLLETMAQYIVHPSVADILKNPKYTAQARTDVCLALGQDVLNDAGRNFIKLLAIHGRLAVLPEIARLFEQLCAASEKTLQVTVKSAVPLSDVQRERLHAALSKKLGQQVVLVYENEPTLLGGLLIKAGDWVMDGSVLGQLGRLRDAVIG